MLRCLPVLGFFLISAASLTGQVTPSTPSQSVPSSQDSSSKPADQSAKPLPYVDPNANSGTDRLLFHLGTISIGGGYYSDPFTPYGPYPFDSYGPYPYSAFYLPQYSAEGSWLPYVWKGRAPYPYDFSYRAQKGEVKLAADPATAEVYIDGAFAGTASRLKRMWLEPGEYDLSVVSPGLETFHQRLYVLTGRSLKVEAKLSQPN